MKIREGGTRLGLRPDIRVGGFCAEPLFDESKAMGHTVSGDLGTVGIGGEDVRRVDFFHFGIGGG